MSTTHEPTNEQRIRRLEEALATRILVLDGATGTALQVENLKAEDFGGPALDGCNENLVLTRPDVCRRLHARYLEAGCDIVETNTFGATALVLAEYDMASKAREINRVAARLAREACAAYDDSPRPRWVAGSMGPTTKAISVTGGVTFDALITVYQEQAEGLLEGGVDYLLLETCQDTLNVKAGLLAIDRAFETVGRRVPIAVSCTIEPTGTMLAGQGVEAFAVSLMHRELLYLGLNCATGPELMRDHVRSLSERTAARVACVPNAGLPNEDGEYNESPAMLASVIGDFAEHGWLNLVGGCCGTTPEHVTALARSVEGVAPRVPPTQRGTWLAGVEFLSVDEDTRPVIVGERTNVLGSRKFKRLIQSRSFEEAAEVGRAQVKGGAHVIDVCLQDPEADEGADMAAFLHEAVKKVRVPFVIDTTDADVMEGALRRMQGKALLNSVNLEDGLERFERVVPLARKYGAALVVGLIDEDPVQGMAITVQRKLEVAERSLRILVDDFGVAEEDIVWDPLVFPCGTGDETYVGSAEQTIEGVRRLKEAFPNTKTVLGISNVSFGLPASGREVLNSVFLYHCVQAGLDLAIVNSEKLERYPSIPENERQLCEDLLYARREDAVERFTEHFRARRPRARAAERQLSLAERLEAYVIEGTKEGLTADLDLALASPDYATPLDIINGPLMAGMAEVGRMFNANELIVAEVLQSAGAMKAAVTHLEPHMEKADGAGRGKVLLATVKGDVHDIGKNLVDIVLSNNGFDVVDLGIKVPSDRIVAAVREHAPDMIGLSGLLVKSAHMMVATAEDLEAAGVDIPVLVGGAALSPGFTYGRIQPAYSGRVAYARDAMHGLDLAARLGDADARPALEAELDAEGEKARKARAAKDAARAAPAAPPVPAPRRDVAAPTVPSTQRVVLSSIPLDDVWSWLNPQMLYGKHLGLKGHVGRLAEAGDAKYRMLEDAVRAMKDSARDGGMHVRGVYRFFPASAAGERVRIFDPETGGEVASFDFPRQTRGDGLCLADFVGAQRDHVAFFVVTAGEGIRAQVGRLREQGHYLESHVLGALAVETAEAAAEWLHADLRARWGFADAPDMTMADRFRCAYRGSRYSFGYPACPDLEEQVKLFRLLQPEEIGVTLTDGCMMDPEASVSAFVVHHPDARYFAAP